MTQEQEPRSPREIIADEVIQRFVSQHPELRRATVVTEIPPPIRWAGIIMAAVMTTSVSAGAIWLVSSVDEMQLMLARMDERTGSWIESQDVRYTQLEKRVERLEQRTNRYEKEQK